MNCPKCQGMMHRVTCDGIEVDQCGGCDGLWFDLREHEHLAAIRGSEDRIDSGDPRRGERFDDLRDVDCPRCGLRLIKLRMAGQTHLRYEQCHHCGGVFFDVGEFTDFKQASLGDRLRRLMPGLFPGHEAAAQKTREPQA